MDDGKMRIVKVGEEITIKPDEVTVSENKVQSSDPANAGKGSEADARGRSGQGKDKKGKSAKQDSRPGPVKSERMISRKATVTEIASGRIVLEEKTKSGPETIILQSNEKEKISENKIPGSKLEEQGTESKTIVLRIRKQQDQQGSNLLRSQASQNAEQKQTNDKLPEQGSK
ncbi:MAG: hypothetical protein K4571_01350 [Deltaproteobacteria bacterium]